MQKNVKAGIVGFGYMGHFHLNRSKEVDGIEVIAAYDNNLAEKRPEIQASGLRFCESLNELLEIPEIDLIIVCTPNDSHKDISIEVLKKEKNVLCEKPAAMNAKEVKEIISVANSVGKFYTVHQNRRWDKDYLAVREVLSSNEIGTFHTINSTAYGQRGVCFGWRADPEHGGGMLYDWGVHLIDQILQMYPEKKLTQIFGRLESILTPTVDDFFEVKLIFENGVCANINVGTFALQPYPRWYILGDRGTLMLNNSDIDGGISRIKGAVKGFESVSGSANFESSRTMAPLSSENIEVLNLKKMPDQKYDFYKNLIKAVKGEEKPYVTNEQIIRLMTVVDTIFESSRIGNVLKVDL